MSLLERIKAAALDRVGTAGVYSDLLSAAVRSVNWHEIAEHLLEESVSAYERRADRPEEA